MKYIATFEGYQDLKDKTYITQRNLHSILKSLKYHPYPIDNIQQYFKNKYLAGVVYYYDSVLDHWSVMFTKLKYAKQFKNFVLKYLSHFNPSGDKLVSNNPYNDNIVLQSLGIDQQETSNKQHFKYAVNIPVLAKS